MKRGSGVIVVQQLVLTGEGADRLAEALFSALAVRPAGYLLTPLRPGGRDKGRVMHVLTGPDDGCENDVPCLLRLAEDRVVAVPEVFEELAAPALRQAAHTRAPILLGGITAEMLACPVFRAAVEGCMQGPRPVVAAASPDAADILRGMASEEPLLVDAAAPEAMETVQHELMMRL